jgi:peptidoglycan hydrolase-like protein with peptidoglycan-binding domain
VKEACHDINGGHNGLDERRTAASTWEKELDYGYQPGHEKVLPLRHGSHGEPVRELQQHLSDLGYTDSKGKPLAVNGDFGNNTQNALTAFQHDNHRTVNGKADSTTLDAIDKAVDKQHKQTGPHTDAGPAQAAPHAQDPSPNGLHERGANAGPDNAPMPKADPSPSSLGNPNRASPLMDPDLRAIFESNGDPAVMGRSAQNYRNSPSGQLFDMQAQAAAARVQPGAPEQQAAQAPRVQQSGPSIG